MTDYGYKAIDSGAIGKTFERDLKAEFNQRAKVAKQGKIDFRRDGKCFEVKTGSGEVKQLLTSKVKYVVFVPVVDMGKPVTMQEGFILDKNTFLEVLTACNLIRHKVTTGGQDTMAIQTFWNRSKNAPHGKAYFKLIDKLYDSCIMTLEEYFDCGGKF